MLMPDRRAALLRDLETILLELGALTPVAGLHSPTERGRLGLEDLRFAQQRQLDLLYFLQGKYRADRRYHALVTTLQRVEAHQLEQSGIAIVALARLAQERKDVDR